jgi:hypothetical protein
MTAEGTVGAPTCLICLEKVLNIVRILIRVDKRTKKTRIICHFVKRFDLILMLNHFGKWRFDYDFKSYFRQMI